MSAASPATADLRRRVPIWARDADGNLRDDFYDKVGTQGFPDYDAGTPALPRSEAQAQLDSAERDVVTRIGSVGEDWPEDVLYAYREAIVSRAAMVIASGKAMADTRLGPEADRLRAIATDDLQAAAVAIRRFGEQSGRPEDPDVPSAEPRFSFGDLYYDSLGAYQPAGMGRASSMIPGADRAYWVQRPGQSIPTLVVPGGG